MDSIHPDKVRLEAFCEGRLSGEETAALQDHIVTCELCREYCETHQRYTADLLEAKSTPLSEGEAELCQRLFAYSLAGQKICMNTLRLEPQISSDRLAADGLDSLRPDPQTSQTYYCENPEVVLRVTPFPNKTSLQLLANISELKANVLISDVKHGLEVVSDQFGMATIEGMMTLAEDPPEWRLTTPFKTIALDPMEFDRTRIEHSEDVILDSGSGDRLKVTLIKRPAGLELRVSPLEIHGDRDWSDLRIAVRSGDDSRIHQIPIGEPLTLSLADHSDFCELCFYI